MTKLCRHRCAALLAIALSAPLANGGLRIAPSYVEVALDQGRPSGSFEVTNTGEKVERYRVAANFFTLEGRGIVRPKDSPYSMAGMIKFNPAEFELPPNAKRQVRFIVLPRGKLDPGEYWAGMEIESLNPQTHKGADANGREFAVQVIPSILVPIFGKVGKVRYEGKIKALQLRGTAEKPELLVSVANTGEGRLGCAATYEVADSAGTVLQSGPLAKSYVFRGSTALFGNLIKPLPAGDYTFRVRCTAPETDKPLTAEEKIHWTAPAAPASRPARDRPPKKIAPADDANSARPAGGSAGKGPITK